MQASKLIPAHIFSSLTDNTEFIDIRLPGSVNNCIRVQQTGFDPTRYAVEKEVHYLDDKNIRQHKTCPVTNFIRWRYQEEPVKDVEFANLE